MSAPHAPGCGCCSGTAVSTPEAITNRPALSAVAYRAGTHSKFKRSMLARFSAADLPVLRALRTREDDDFTIALVDAWSMVADVLTFYQERIANESFLRTATERRSLLELSRLIGYELRPGVAASVYLAFTLEEAPGAPDQATRRTVIDPGTRVQSIPAPGEKPQAFETIEKIEARLAWNAMRPRLSRRHPIVGNTTAPLLFAGLATGLKPGDGLLLIPDEGGSVFREVASVTLQASQQRTQVRLVPLPSAITAVVSSVSLGNLTSIASVTSGVGAVTAGLMGKPLSSANLRASALKSRFIEENVFANLVAIRPPPPAVVAFRTRAAIFGHNAPLWKSLPKQLKFGEFAQISKTESDWVPGIFSTRESSWADTANLQSYGALTGNGGGVFLDNPYATLLKNSRVVLKNGSTALDYTVDDATEVSKSDFNLSAKVTRLALSSATGLESFGIRTTTVYGGSEELQLARLPIEAPVSGTQIELEGWIEGLYVGQSIIISGELNTMRGVRASEHAILLDVQHVMDVEGATRIRVAQLANAYVRETVTIYGNVARASHGESVQEVLGSGDGAEAFQTFSLKQPPLTYIKASNARGAQSTLQVRVNDLLWHEAPALVGHGPRDRVFVTRIDDDGTTRVSFGDGVTGARLPTGRQNLRAFYRKGLGVEGLVKAGQLSLLLTRPLGVKGVTNPLAAEGAADRESPDDARRNAPLTVLTLDRAVSLRDYENFARAFAGVAKALATLATERGERVILITVAGPDGAEIRGDSTTHRNLLAAIMKAGDPFVSVRVESYRPAFFRVRATIKLHPDYVSEKVLQAVEAGLRARFGFDAREFGQPVALSEVVATIQAVEGVVATDVDELHRVDADAVPLNARLTAAAPQAGGSADAAAELLMLDPAPLRLGVMA